ncbi:MAG: hypothetical protein ABDH25_04080 [Dictyoglomaceae bacterium]
MKITIEFWKIYNSGGKNLGRSSYIKGRWDLISPHHKDPEKIIPFEMRAKKNISLYDYLSRSKEFKTEQSLI